MDRLQGMLASGAAAGGQSGSSSFAPASGGGGMGLSAGLEGGGGQSYPPAGPSAGAVGASRSMGLVSSAASASGSGGGGGGVPRGIASAANPATKGRTARGGRAQAAPPPSYSPPPTTAEAQAAYAAAEKAILALTRAGMKNTTEYTQAKTARRIASEDLKRAKKVEARSVSATVGGEGAGASGGGYSGKRRAYDSPQGAATAAADAGGSGGGGTRGAPSRRVRPRRGGATVGRTGATAGAGGASVGTDGEGGGGGGAAAPGETASGILGQVASGAGIVPQAGDIDSAGIGDLLSLASGADVVTTSQLASGSQGSAPRFPLPRSGVRGAALPPPPAGGPGATSFSGFDYLSDAPLTDLRAAAGVVAPLNLASSANRSSGGDGFSSATGSAASGSSSGGGGGAPKGLGSRAVIPAFAAAASAPLSSVTLSAAGPAISAASGPTAGDAGLGIIAPSAPPPTIAAPITHSVVAATSVAVAPLPPAESSIATSAAAATGSSLAPVSLPSLSSSALSAAAASTDPAAGLSLTGSFPTSFDTASHDAKALSGVNPESAASSEKPRADNSSSLSVEDITATGDGGTGNPDDTNGNGAAEDTR